MTGFLRGVATALITPFTEHGVNFQTLEELLFFQEQGGADAVVILGTTGEAATMSETEREEVILFARKRVGKMKLVVGTGSNCTERAVAMSKRAEELGADGVLAVTPYYNKCTQRGLVAYYRAIAEAVSLPVIAYNVPARTGVNILPHTMSEIASIENIAGVKEASGNMAQAIETANLIRGRCDLYCGEDALNLPFLAIGATALVSVLSNLVPTDVKALTESVFRGDLPAANRISDALLPLAKACFAEVNPIPVKEGMRLLGFDVGNPRPPLTPIEPQNSAFLAAAMREYGLQVKA